MQKFPTTKDGIEKVSDIIISQIHENKDTYIIKEKEFSSVTAIFLAGAPGCGKTEFILSVLSEYDFFFIDIDSYRDYFEGYCGKNASEYQEAISGVVNKVLKYCLKNNIKFILDGTFKSRKHSLKNIDECKKYKRSTQIYYIFQNPYKSYFYTYLRELKEERNIKVDKFIECFYNSIVNIYTAKESYKNTSLFIVEKNPSNTLKNKKYNIYDYQEISDIQKFCKKFDISYNSDTCDFPFRHNLENGITSFSNILKSPLISFFIKILGQKKRKQ